MSAEQPLALLAVSTLLAVVHSASRAPAAAAQTKAAQGFVQTMVAQVDEHSRVAPAVAHYAWTSAAVA